jgi:O-antigen/teichoic acid export membrane protein
MNRAAFSLVTYGGSTLCFGVLAILTIPIMISVGGVGDWTSVVAGQTIGIFTSMVISYGWSLAGPSKVNKAETDELFNLYVESLRMRMIIVLPACGATVLLTFLLVPSLDVGLLVLGVLASALLGLRANWFFIGLDQPSNLLKFDTAPRVVFIALGLVAGISFESIRVIVLGQIIGLLLSVALASISITRATRTAQRSRLATVRAGFAANTDSSIAAIVGSLYSALPIIIVGAVNPAILPVYALLDRLWKQINTATSPLFDLARSRLPKETDIRHDAKIWSMIKVGAVLTFLGSVALVVVGPVLLGYLSAGEITVERSVLIAFGALYLLANLTMLSEQIGMIAHGRIREMRRSILISVPLGLVLMVLLAVPFGLLGAFAGLGAGFALRLTIGIRTIT